MTKTQSPYLRTPQAAEYVGIPKRTLERMRLTGGGPPFFKPGGRRIVIYLRDDLDHWVQDGGRLKSTSDSGGESERLRI